MKNVGPQCAEQCSGTASLNGPSFTPIELLFVAPWPALQTAPLSRNTPACWYDHSVDTWTARVPPTGSMSYLFQPRSVPVLPSENRSKRGALPVILPAIKESLYVLFPDFS